jgi:hypothetical protein
VCALEFELFKFSILIKERRKGYREAEPRRKEAVR